METEPLPARHSASASFFLPLILVISEPLTGNPLTDPELVHLQEYSLVQELSMTNKKRNETDVFFIGRFYGT